MHHLQTVYTTPSKDRNGKEKCAKADTNPLGSAYVLTDLLMGLCFSGCFVLQGLNKTQRSEILACIKRCGNRIKRRGER